MAKSKEYLILAGTSKEKLKEAVEKLLNERDGLALGICNGFQALIKLGLVPYGEIIDTDETCPTLSYNVIGRHQSKIVRTRIASNKSPWLSLMNVGDVVNIEIRPKDFGRIAAQTAKQVVVQKIREAERDIVFTEYNDKKGEIVSGLVQKADKNIVVMDFFLTCEGVDDNFLSFYNTVKYCLIYTLR